MRQDSERLWVSARLSKIQDAGRVASVDAKLSVWSESVMFG